MIIQSPAFEHQQPIPKKYTCQGENVSPPLSFGEIPKGAKSLVLIVEDPDAPIGTFDHWIVWNLDPNVSGLKEGARIASAFQGRNGFGNSSYGGPCPPPGDPHRYFFKLFALNTNLDLPPSSSKKNVEAAMQGHIIDSAELIGTFKR